MIGDTTRIITKIQDLNLSSDGISIIDPSTDANRQSLATLLYSKRQHKGMTLEEATALALNPLWYGALLVEAGTPTVWLQVQSTLPVMFYGQGFR